MDMIQAGLLKEVEPMFTKIPSPFRLHRFDAGDARYYMTVFEDGTINKSYLSVTEFCKRSLATSPYLLDWMKTHGQRADYMRDERASYGTCMHIYIADTLLKGYVSFDECRAFAIESAMSNGFPESVTRWMLDLPMDVASFYAFYKDKIVDVIGLEFPVLSDEWGVAGTIDLIAKIRFNRGIVTGIIDLKSGRKGFWDTHKLQLQVYKLAWNEHFRDFPVTHLFNWAPSNWKKDPTYKFENQTGTEFSKTVMSRLRIMRHEGWNEPPKERMWLQGDFDIRDFVPSRHITTVKMRQEYVQPEMFSENIEP